MKNRDFDTSHVVTYSYSPDAAVRKIVQPDGTYTMHELLPEERARILPMLKALRELITNGEPGMEVSLGKGSDDEDPENDDEQGPPFIER